MKIGPWRTTGILGHGGMGTVYEAVRDDGHFDKSVAIKILDLGADSAAEEHFRAERQILATLMHPNIALLLDGGTTAQGQSFLVMERVDGVPIDEFAERETLPVSARLNVFLDLCSAVQYAHQHLVVHRDIKPANVLITSSGVPKLLDFGIAKLLDDSAATQSTLRLLTPDHAAPEQLRGEPVTAATDVYQLGVLLYELLTGKNPHTITAGAADEVERAVCEVMPPRPSTVAADPKIRRELEGDLDTIVLAAIRKESERRYPSVERLAADLRRYRNGQPVSARNDTFLYRTTKLIQRRRLAFFTAVTVLVTLAAGAVVSIREAARAERRFAQVRRLANSYLFDFHDQIRNLPGSMETRQLVVNTALGYLNSLRAEAGDDETLEWDIANGYEKVGDAQGYPFTSNLGQSTAARESYVRALAIKERLAARSSDPARFRSIAQTYLRLADLQTETGDTRGAGESMRRWEAAMGRVGAQSGDDFRILGLGYTRLGQVRSMGGDVQGMLDAFKSSQQHLQKLFDLLPDARAHDLLASCYQRLGYGHIWYGDVPAAIPLYRRAIELSERAVALEPLNTSYQRNLTLAYISLGDVLGSPFHVNLGDIRAAVPFYAKAIETSSRMAEADPRNAQTRVMLNNSRTRFATTLLYSEPRRALAMYREALHAIDALVDAEARNTVFRRDRGFTLLDIGIAYERLDDRVSALRYFRLALDQQQAVVFADKARTQFRQDLIPTHLAIARLETSRAEARFHLERALELAEAQQAASPHNLYTIRNLADTFEALGEHARGAGGTKEARGWFEKNVNLWRTWEAGHPVSPYSAGRRRRAERLVEETNR